MNQTTIGSTEPTSDNPSAPRVASFQPGVPRYKQKYEHLHVNYVRPGLTKAFSGACRDRGVKCYSVIEKLIDAWIAGELNLPCDGSR